MTGTPGAVAEFMTAFGQTPHVELKQHELTCYTDTGSLRLKRHDQMRAFAFEKLDRLCSAWQERLSITSKTVFTELGVDSEAGASDYRSHLLFNYGLGRKFSPFCIRTNKGIPDSDVEGLRGPTLADPHGGSLPRSLLKALIEVFVEFALARILASNRDPVTFLAFTRTNIIRTFFPHSWRGERKSAPSLALPRQCRANGNLQPRSRRQAV